LKIDLFDRAPRESVTEEQEDAANVRCKCLIYNFVGGSISEEVITLLD